MNSTTYSGGNGLLDRLSSVALNALHAQIEVVELTVGRELYAGAAEHDLAYFYFPISAVASMLIATVEGGAVEAGTIGREGMVGAQCAFGSDRMLERCVIQIAGLAARIKLAHFRLFLRENALMSRTVNLYMQLYVGVLAQSVACNTRHALIERCARWLLLTHDRAGRDEFYLTQEFLAIMLGVRRPGVSVAAATLANAGFITYTRGAMKITDRPGLMTASCECYGVMQRESERLLGAPAVESFASFARPARAT